LYILYIYETKGLRVSTLIEFSIPSFWFLVFIYLNSLSQARFSYFCYRDLATFPPISKATILVPTFFASQYKSKTGRPLRVSSQEKRIIKSGRFSFSDFCFFVKLYFSIIFYCSPPTQPARAFSSIFSVQDFERTFFCSLYIGIWVWRNLSQSFFILNKNNINTWKQAGKTFSEPGYGFCEWKSAKVLLN
jgi:hypothetical protein